MTELTEKPCAHCHNLFTPTKKHQKYCKRPECKKDRQRAYKVEYEKRIGGNKRKYVCKQRQHKGIDWVHGEELIRSGLTPKEIAVVLGCESSTVHWRIRKMKREAENPIDRSFNYGPPGHCDRGTKRGFVRYMKHNPFYYQDRAGWKNIDPEQAWEGMIGSEE